MEKITFASADSQENEEFFVLEQYLIFLSRIRKKTMQNVGF